MVPAWACTSAPLAAGYTWLIDRCVVRHAPRDWAPDRLPAASTARVGTPAVLSSCSGRHGAAPAPDGCPAGREHTLGVKPRRSIGGYLKGRLALVCSDSVRRRLRLTCLVQNQAL